MKHLSILILIVVPLAVSAQDDAAPDYAMFETNYLNVHPDKWQEFGEAMTSHNQTFHAEGPYRAFVRWVVNGPRTGQIVWVMGPTTFTHLDSRPNDDGHTNDWMNVLSYTDGTAYTEYWRMNQDMSFKRDTVIQPIVRVRIIDVARDEGYRFTALLEKIREVLVQKDYPNEWNVYYNRFWSDDGRDQALVTSYDTWSELDRESAFVADFHEVHGMGSWDRFLEEWEDSVDGAYDEYRQLIPEMSGL